MKILAMESSAVTASVCVCEDGRLLSEYTVNNGNTHSETLLPMTESMLRLLGLSVSDVDLFAVSNGPGSFTGIRIGVATVKGLAFGTGKPCIGVSTLEALAENLNLADGALVCPVMNARRGQVYTALFRIKNGIPSRITPDSAISIEELDNLLDDFSEPVTLCGDGYELVYGALKHPVFPTPERIRLQSAFSVAQVAYRAFLSGVRTTDAQMNPVYLRPCQAERERAEREKERNR